MTSRGTIEDVYRRCAARLLAAALTASLLACSAGPPRPAGPGGSAGRSSAAPPAGQPGVGEPGAGQPGAGAGRPPAGRAPAKPFPVGVRQLSLNRGGDRKLPVTIWYPARSGSRDAPRSDATAAAGRFPVVVFSHGLGGQPADYRALVAGWAAAGFVVVAPAYPFTARGVARLNVLDVLSQPADASFVLTEVLALDRRSGDRLRGHLDGERVAAAGHSAGGITTVGLFAGSRDSRLDAGIVLAGSSLGVGTGFAGAAVPLLFVHGQRDEVVSYASGKALYDAVPWPKALLTLPAGGHALSPDGGGFDTVATGTTDFLRWSLYGDPAAKQRLDRQSRTGGQRASFDNRL